MVLGLFVQWPQIELLVYGSSLKSYRSVYIEWPLNGMVKMKNYLLHTL